MAKINNLRKATIDKNIFYICIVALPLLQFIVFYVSVNVNSVLLAFKEYDYQTGKYSLAGVLNFKSVYNDWTMSSILKTAFKNSSILYLSGLFIGTVLSVVFSYYIYKKMPFSAIFKVMLFLPSIISSIVMVIMFRFFVERAIPEFASLVFKKSITGPLSSINTTFPTIVFYSLWVGFGSSMLLYSGAMGQISESVVESAKLEGVKAIQELWHITLPSVFPTLTTFLVVGVASFFTNQGHLYSFYGSMADDNIVTLGYFLFIKVVGKTATLADYPYAAAAGLTMTFIAVPLTMLVKVLLEKYGPSEN